MGRLRRIDSELVRRKYAPSRTKAAQMIQDGLVKLDGQVVVKPARQVDPAQAIEVTESAQDGYASRGAYKLSGALDILGANAPSITNVRALDAGASTGGFTDVLLRRGAASVVAVDVGYGQMVWRLRTDPRVELLERTNVRTLEPEQVGEPPSLVVGDLSFISLTLVIPALAKVSAADAHFLLMVKPQFEIGKDRLGHGGVVRDPAHRIETVLKVASCAVENGLIVHACAASPLPGPSGNVEYFLHMSKTGTQCSEEQLTKMVEDAVAAGPQGAHK